MSVRWPATPFLAVDLAVLDAYIERVAGWAEALRWFEDHPDEAVAMGQRALELRRTRFNSRIFGRQLADVLAEVCGRSHPSPASILPQ